MARASFVAKVVGTAQAMWLVAQLLLATAPSAAVAQGQLQCVWHFMPMPSTDPLVVQSAKLATEAMQQRGEFAGTVEAYDELFTLMGPNATAELAQEDLIPEAVLCNLESVDIVSSEQLITEACVSPNSQANWMLNIRVEYGIRAPGCNLVGMAAAEVAFPYGPFKPPEAVPEVVAAEFLEWVVWGTSQAIAG